MSSLNERNVQNKVLIESQNMLTKNGQKSDIGGITVGVDDGCNVMSRGFNSQAKGTLGRKGGKLEI